MVPGLIDLHTHVYYGGITLGVKADPISAKSGVTTFVDAGSAGAGNFTEVAVWRYFNTLI